MLVTKRKHVLSYTIKKKKKKNKRLPLRPLTDVRRLPTLAWHQPITRLISSGGRQPQQTGARVVAGNGIFFNNCNGAFFSSVEITKYSTNKAPKKKPFLSSWAL